MWESTLCVDFQGLWEEWDSFIVPRFPSGRHFHRGRRGEFCFVVWSIELARALLVSDLVTISHDLRQSLDILLRLHSSECMSQPLVFDDGRVTDALIFAEDAIGKRVTFPSHLERTIRKVIDLDVLTCQTVRQITSFKNDLLAVIGESELLTYVALFTVALEEPARSDCDAGSQP
jgi:hypothetical protein